MKQNLDVLCECPLCPDMFFHHFLSSCSCCLVMPDFLHGYLNFLQSGQLNPLAGMSFPSHSSPVRKWWAFPQQHSQTVQGNGIFPLQCCLQQSGSVHESTTAMTLAAHLCCPKRLVKSWKPECFVEQTEQTSFGSSGGYTDPVLTFMVTEDSLSYRQCSSAIHIPLLEIPWYL